VPTAAWRRGDFSDLLAAGAKYQIYDPLTTVAEGSLFRRQPIPKNIIPASRLDKVGLNMVNRYPLPNQPGLGVEKTNNFYSDAPNDEKYWSQLMRFDHAINDRNCTFARMYSGHWNELKDLYFGDISGTHLQRFYRGVALDHVYAISPTMVLNIRYGLTNQDFLESRPTRGYDLAQLGSSTNLISLIDSKLATVPYISNGFQTIGFTDTGDGGCTAVTNSLSGTLQKIHNANQIKIGADYRVYRALENRYPQDHRWERVARRESGVPGTGTGPFLTHEEMRSDLVAYPIAASQGGWSGGRAIHNPRRRRIPRLGARLQGRRPGGFEF
jgi:hypothetical protein